jgi:hypothetical protein
LEGTPDRLDRRNWGALSLTILLAALLWVLISIPVAIAVGTVIIFGQSDDHRRYSEPDTLDRFLREE